MNLLQKVWKTGELPTVNTEVTVETDTIIKIALAVVVTTVIVILSIKIFKRV